MAEEEKAKAGDQSEFGGSPENQEILRTFSPEETLELGRRFGLSAVPGQVLCLDGDLGAGKTVFAKGFAQGLGIEEDVVSPTFTILQEYESGRLPLYHFDVYRIEDPEEMAEVGYEDYFYGDGVCLVEWATLIPELIPQNAIRIEIQRPAFAGDPGEKKILEQALSDDERIIRITRGA